MRTPIRNLCPPATTDSKPYTPDCIAKFLSSSLIWLRSHPAVFRLMNAGQAKDEGKMYENTLQTGGNAVTGHEKPVRNIAMGEMKSNVTSTVSLLWKNELQNDTKHTQAVT